MTGFEPAAPSSRTKYATKLRYIPVEFTYELRPYQYNSREAIAQRAGGILAPKFHLGNSKSENLFENFWRQGAVGTLLALYPSVKPRSTFD